VHQAGRRGLGGPRLSEDKEFTHGEALVVEKGLGREEAAAQTIWSMADETPKRGQNELDLTQYDPTSVLKKRPFVLPGPLSDLRDCTTI
jgi:hypothetical protein